MRIAHGIDIVSVKRITSAIQRGGDAFLKRVFTKAEADFCRSRARQFEHYAARFAAKEAFIKALGDRAHAVALNQIEVCKQSSGKPYLALSAAVLKSAGLSRKTVIELSLSHERDFAVASVILVSPERTRAL